MTTATTNPPQAAPPSLLDGLAEILADRQRAEADQRRTTEAAYVALVLRNADPQLGDAEALATAMASLNVSREQLGADLDHARRARHFTQLVDQLAEAGPALTAARAHHAATVARCHQEIDAANRAMTRAEGRLSQCSGARDQLNELARRRPALFDTSVTPPRLRASA